MPPVTRAMNGIVRPVRDRYTPDPMTVFSDDFSDVSYDDEDESWSDEDLSDVSSIMTSTDDDEEPCQ